MGGVIGSLQAMEAVKYILGVGDLLTGYLLTYDALKWNSARLSCPQIHQAVQYAATIRLLRN